MTWSTWAADSARAGRVFLLATLAWLAVPIAIVRADGSEEAFEEPPSRGVRTLESSWRRPAGCDVPPPVAFDRSGGGRTLSATSEAAPCRMAPEPDFADWIGPVWVEAPAPGRPRPPHRPRR